MSKNNSEIKKYKKEIVAVEEINKGLSIKSQEDLETAKQLLSNIASIKKEVLGKKNFAPLLEKIKKEENFVREKILGGIRNVSK